MAVRCHCRSVTAFAGAKATSYANRYLTQVSAGDRSARLMRCRVCGAYWEMDEEALSEEGSWRVRLHRIRQPSVVEDWNMYENDERD
jgi:hypothetical protein